MLALLATRSGSPAISPASWPASSVRPRALRAHPVGPLPNKGDAGACYIGDRKSDIIRGHDGIAPGLTLLIDRAGGNGQRACSASGFIDLSYSPAAVRARGAGRGRLRAGRGAPGQARGRPREPGRQVCAAPWILPRRSHRACADRAGDERAAAKRTPGSTIPPTLATTRLAVAALSGSP